MEQIAQLKLKNRALSLAIIGLSIFVAYNFIYKRQTQKVESLKESAVQETRKNEVLKNIAILEEKLAVYEEGLPKKDVSLLLSALNTIASESGVKLDTLRPASPQAGPFFTKDPFNLSFKTDNYHTLGRSVSKLESSSDCFIVEEANIRPEGKTGVLSVDLLISKIIAAD